MAQVYKDRIIKLLKHSDYEPLKLGQLAKALGINSEDYPQFKDSFEQLRHAGHVVIGAKNLISLPSLSGQIVGTFRANPKGFGFVIPRQANAHGDLFIPPDATAEKRPATGNWLKSNCQDVQYDPSQRFIQIAPSLARVNTLSRSAAGSR